MAKQAENSNKSPVNPVALIRKRLGDERGKRMSQAEFAELIEVEAKYVSMLETKVRPVSRKIAEKIVKIAPPGTRIEWLMGEDQFETEKDLFDFECVTARRDSERAGIMEEELLKRIASLAGYKMERVEMPLDEFLQGGESYIFIDASGKRTGLGYFGSGGVQELWYDFFDYAAFRLKRTVEKKSIEWTISSGKGENNG